MHRIGRTGALLVATALVVLGGCPLNPLAFRAADPYTLAAEFDNGQSLEVDWRNGEITVTIDATATQLSVNGEKFAYSSTQAAADEGLPNIEVTLAPSVTDPNTYTLDFSAPTGGGVIYGASAEIIIPVGATLVIDTQSGDVVVNGNTGNTTVSVANGGVNISQTSGDTDASTQNGVIAITSLDGNITAQSQNGSIALESAGGNVAASTQNGSIGLIANPDPNGTVEATTENGSVTIQVPSTFAASLALTVQAGSITLVNDLADFTVTELNQGAQTVTATLNGGGGSITGRSQLGSVTFGAISP